VIIAIENVADKEDDQLIKAFDTSIASPMEGRRSFTLMINQLGFCG
jgi:hypothetical protein